MQLKLRRSQRDGGVISRNVIFCLDARVEFTTEEQRHITRYKLHNEVIYNSEASARYLARADAQRDGSIKGNLKSIASVAMAAMRLNISIASLQKGQHVACKSLDELLGAEDAIMTACQNLRAYLDTAATFDGREVLFDFAGGGPGLIAHSGGAPALAVAPPAALPPPAAALPPPPPGDQVAEAGPASSYKTDGPSPWEWWADLTDGQRKIILGVLAVFLLLILMKCGQR